MRNFTIVPSTTLIMFACLTGAANADFQLSIERISDTRARLTGSGEIPISRSDVPGGLGFFRLLNDPVLGDRSEDVDHDLSENTLMIGGSGVNVARTGQGEDIQDIRAVFSLNLRAPSMEEADQIDMDDEVSGSVVVDLLSGLEWAAVGSEGTIQWGNPEAPATTGTPELAVGTWAVVSATPVPEPAAITMWGLTAGLSLVIAARRKRS